MDWGQVVHQMEGDRWQGNHVVYEGDSHVSRSFDCVVSVPWVLGLIWSAIPIEVEER